MTIIDDAILKQIQREGVMKYLESFPAGANVQMDRKLLDSLLFDYVNTSKGYVKLPVWSGEFLSKLDLSEISFKRVSWGFFAKGFVYGSYKTDGVENSSYFDHLFKNELAHIDYRNTNAKIDFSESFEALTGKDRRAIICHCDFSGTDLSSNFVSCLQSVVGSRFDRTNINFEGSLNSYYSSTIKSSSFSGNDLEGIQTSLLYLLLDWGGNENNDFSGTKINFTFQAKDFSVQDGAFFLGMRSKLIDYLRKGYLRGCFINGVLVPDTEEEQMAFLESIFLGSEKHSLAFKKKEQ